MFKFPRSGVFLLFKICHWSLENTRESALNFWLRATFWASCSCYLVVVKALLGWHGAGTHAVALASIRDTSVTLPEALLFCSKPQLCRGELPRKKFLFSAYLEVKSGCCLLLLAWESSLEQLRCDHSARAHLPVCTFSAVTKVHFIVFSLLLWSRYYYRGL